MGRRCPAYGGVGSRLGGITIGVLGNDFKVIRLSSRHVGSEAVWSLHGLVGVGIRRFEIGIDLVAADTQ